MRKTLKVVAFGGGPADAFIKAAGITDSTQQTAIKTLVNDLNGYGLWTKMKAIYPMVGGNATAHSYNLKDTTKFQITWNGGLTHSSNGVLPNGTTGYGDTNFNPFSNSSLNSQHISFYSKTDSYTDSIDMGCEPNGSWSYFTFLEINRNAAGGTRRLSINGSSVTGASGLGDIDSTGFYLGSRIASNDERLFKNNTKIYSSTNPSVSLINKNIFLFAVNSNITTGYSSKQCAFATIGEGLSDTEAANLYTSIQKFQTTLNRFVGTPIYSSFDSDAQSFMTSASITDSTQQAAVNYLVTDLKSNNLWTKMKAVYPMVGGNATSHSYNLKNPSQFQITFSGGWTHDSTGALPNGTNAYGDTKLVGTVDILSSNAGMGIYSGTQGTSAGAFGTGPNYHIFPRYTDNNTYYRLFNASGISNNNGSSLGLIHGYSNGTNSYGYYNSASIGSMVVNNSGDSLQNLWLARMVGNYDNHQLRFAFASLYLTNTEASNLYTIIQNYQTILNRQV